MKPHPHTESPLERRARPEAEAAFAVLQRIMRERGEPERPGCYLSFGYDRNGTARIHICPLEVGHVPDDKHDRYSELSLEKIERLARNPGHLLSGQSADPERDKWPGAVRDDNSGKDGDDGLAGVSGLPALADEAMALNWLVRIGLLSRQGAVERAKISNNPYFAAMTEADFIPATA